MDAPKSMTIYLSGPIDDIPLEMAGGWRQEVGQDGSSGCLFFNPVGAFIGAGLGTAREVDHMNRVAIVHCDGVLVNLSGPGVGFGSIREIEFARLHGKPVAVAHGGFPIVSLMAHDLMLTETVDEALTLLMTAIRERQDEPRGMTIQLPGFFQHDVDEEDERDA